MTDVTAAVSPLRRRMIDDMSVRNLSPATQRSYIHAVKRFSPFHGRSPDQLGLEDARGILRLTKLWRMESTRADGAMPFMAAPPCQARADRLINGQRAQRNMVADPAEHHHRPIRCSRLRSSRAPSSIGSATTATSSRPATTASSSKTAPLSGPRPGRRKAHFDPKMRPET